MPMNETAFNTKLQHVADNDSRHPVLVFEDMDTAQVIRLAKALKSNTSLVMLHLGKSQLGDEGGKAIADALKTNAFLLKLYLDKNQLGGEGAKAIANALKIEKEYLPAEICDLQGNPLCLNTDIHSELQVRSVKANASTSQLINSTSPSHPHSISVPHAAGSRLNRLKKRPGDRLVHTQTHKPFRTEVELLQALAENAVTLRRFVDKNGTDTTLEGVALATAIDKNEVLLYDTYRKQEKRHQQAQTIAMASQGRQSNTAQIQPLTTLLPKLEPRSSNSITPTIATDPDGLMAFQNLTQAALDNKRTPKRNREETDENVDPNKKQRKTVPLKQHLGDRLVHVQTGEPFITAIKLLKALAENAVTLRRFVDKNGTDTTLEGVALATAIDKNEVLLYDTYQKQQKRHPQTQATATASQRKQSNYARQPLSNIIISTAKLESPTVKLEPRSSSSSSFLPHYQDLHSNRVDPNIQPSANAATTTVQPMQDEEEVIEEASGRVQLIALQNVDQKVKNRTSNLSL